MRKLWNISGIWDVSQHPDKSVTFSSCRAHRALLRVKEWQSLGGTKVKVATNVRDLGTHLNFGDALIGSTINDRMVLATDIADKVARVTMPRVKKLRIIKGLILAKSLYGTEAAEPSCKRVDALTTAIVKAMGIRNERRSIALAYEANQEAGELDPRINMLVRKVTLLRRIIARRPDMQKIISGIIDEYNTLYANTPMATLPRNKLPCRGPVGLLVLHLRISGMTIDNELVISKNKVRVLNVIKVPWQEVKPRIIYIMRKNRHEVTKTQRSELAEAGSFGHDILDRAMKIDRRGQVYTDIATHAGEI